MKRLYVPPLNAWLVITLSLVRSVSDEGMRTGHSNLGFLAAGIELQSQSNGTVLAVKLLPGTYTPALLSRLVNQTTTELFQSPVATSGIGFTTSGSPSASSTVTLNSGITLYDTPLFQGQATHVDLPSSSNASAPNSNSNTTTEVPTAQSLLLQSSLYAIFNEENGGRFILWNSVPSIAELPGSPSQLSLVEIQSTKCASACASGGVCGRDGTCVCREGWSGETCSECA